jgi:hypothetical protein
MRRLNSMAIFKRKYIPLVLDGRKVQTRRVHKQEWQVGKTYAVRDTWFSKPQGRIVVLRKFRQRLGDISTEDVRKEGFSTLDEFEEAWIKINGSWDADKVVIVYEFKLVRSPSLQR